jgi:Kef-type K+ transport system membrane component KefB/mannitol/fructose-specific phosphotransferase system IIA component (Ntr-type)
MVRLTPDELTAFFFGLGVLLATARILGETAIRFHQPAVLGELLAGVVLGPTIFGAFLPEWQTAVFPAEGNFPILLEGLTTLAIALFLLVAGMEVDLSVVWRQGKVAAIIGSCSLLFPFAFGFLLGYAFPSIMGAEPGGDHLTFALFLGTALSISALPIVAKILRDLKLFRTDLGVLIIAAATLNDLVGWVIFAIILSLMGSAASHGPSIATTLALTVVFSTMMLSLGPWLIHRTLPWIQANTTWPAGVLGFSLAGALFCAAFAEKIGIHAIFGTFLFGVALGDSKHLRQQTRSTIDQFISFIFAPLFFASIGLKVNFAEHFDPMLTLYVVSAATLVKLLGSRLGGYLSGLSAKESWAIGFGLNARGAMEIILSLVALDAGLIGERMFVAMVAMAILTSLFSGTAIQLILKIRKGHRFLDFLPSKGLLTRLQTRQRRECIVELSELISRSSKLDPDEVAAAVWDREQIMPTGLPNRLAIPHARLADLKEPKVVIGFSEEGIDFDSRDGHLARLIFLILTPKNDPTSQIEILADIARTFQDPEMVGKTLSVESVNELRALIKSEEPSGERKREG